MKNAVIYTRSASPNDQAMNAQIKVCREYASAHGYNVVAEYSDNGKTGTNFNSPAFNAMNTSRDKWETLIIFSIDKLSRNYKALSRYIKALRDEGKEIISTAEPHFNEIFTMSDSLQGLNANYKKGVQSK